ncbi:hypothetical protein ACFL20_00505 [Spirochaetota bacterium]
MDSFALINDLYNRIVNINSSNSRDAIPHSDVFYKQMMSQLGIDRRTLTLILDILKESHKILSIDIVKEDKKRKIDKIVGYVDADLKTLGRLKNYFGSLLADMYEKDYNKKYSPYRVIQEIFPKMNLLNNSPIGHIGNKAIMLSEFENLIEKRYQEYTEKWKSDTLDMLLKQDRFRSINKIELKEDVPKEEPREKVLKEKSRRAVDSDQYEEFLSKSANYPLSTIFKIYGASFFYRIHLRKYNFKFLLDLITSKEINKKTDLKILKDMIGKVKSNFDRDPNLHDYKEDIYKLDRILSRFMHGRK